MEDQVEEKTNPEIITYLKTYSPPRFLDRQKLTGSVTSVKRRHSKTSLTKCVKLLYEAWGEAFKLAGLTAEPEKDADEENIGKQLYPLRSVDLLAEKLESLHLEEKELAVSAGGEGGSDMDMCAEEVDEQTDSRGAFQ